MRAPRTFVVTLLLGLTVSSPGCDCSDEGTPPPLGTDGGAMDGDSPPRPDGGGCPTYQALCGATCIPTSVDPDNCGGCGITCGSGQVCSGGACTGACLPGLTGCDRACVDLMVDDAHCGACGSACAAGTGCVDGRCETRLITGDPPMMCAGGGPPLTIDTGTGGICAGSLATRTFRWAICSCQDFATSGPLLTDGYDSTMGPYMPGGLGGSVGLNDEFQSSSTSDIWGALWASASTGMNPSNDLTVHQDIHVGGPFSPNTTVIGGDAYVDGEVRTAASIEIAGVLHQQTGATVTGDVTFMSRVEEEVSVPPPCDCAPESLIPVADIVAARESANDNALIGLDPSALVNPSGPVRVDLPCGHYYLDGITGSRPIAIVAHGHVALYVGGDVQVSNSLRIAVDPTGSLDIFVSGNWGGSSALTIGSPSYPALTRFYLATTRGFQISADARLAAFFYAPFGPAGTSASFELYGGLFAGDFHASADVSVHYDRAVLSTGEACSGPPPSTCTSCGDCDNQACVGGMCGACTDSSECCAPLECAMGRCLPSLI